MQLLLINKGTSIATTVGNVENKPWSGKKEKDIKLTGKRTHIFCGRGHTLDVGCMCTTVMNGSPEEDGLLEGKWHQFQLFVYRTHQNKLLQQDFLFKVKLQTSHNTSQGICKWSGVPQWSTWIRLSQQSSSSIREKKILQRNVQSAERTSC